MSFFEASPKQRLIALHSARSPTWVDVLLYVAVAIIWLIPDRRFLHDHTADGSDSAPGHPQ